MHPQFELSPEPLLKSGLGRLARYGTHQKIISGGGGGWTEVSFIWHKIGMASGGAIIQACMLS